MRFPPHSLVCASIAAALLSSGANAGGLFWTDRLSGNQKVRACNFDGSNVRDIRDLAPNDPRGVVIDLAADRLYFITRDNGTLQSVGFTASLGAQHVTGLSGAADLRLDALNRVLYWCEESGGLIRKVQLPPPNAIPGALVPATVISGISSPYYLDFSLSAGKLYWGQNGASIFSGPLAGGVADPALFSGGSDIRGVCVDPAAAMLYWAERGNRVVRRRPITGGQVQNLYPGLDTPHGVVLDLPAGKLYWVDTGTNNAGGFNARGVSRGDLDGSTSAEIIVPGASSNQPWDLDLDPRTTTYAQWRSRFFRLDAQASVINPSADPDSDGLLNLAEYGLGTPPLRGNAQAPYESTSVTEMSEEYPAIRFRRRARANDLTYRVQISNDLATWRDNTSPGGPYTFEVNATPADEGMEWVTVRSGAPVSAPPAQQYFRVVLESSTAGAAVATSSRAKARKSRSHR